MNARDPDWSLYRSFLAVLREKSLSAAARALNLTQPTLARHIDTLEAAMGFKLFTRSQQGLSPTEGALELTPYAESLEANTAAILRTASGLGQAAKGTGRISVAINSLDDPEAMPPTKQYGTESKVSWMDGIHALPAQRTDEWLKDKAAQMIDNQRSA